MSEMEHMLAVAVLDAKDAEIQRLRVENEKLRKIISDSVAALESGFCSTDASLEFMADVPKEIRLTIKSLRANQPRACPCLHTTPCHPRCTCVNGFSSHGCSRCCTYGSSDQQKAMAERLVANQLTLIRPPFSPEKLPRVGQALIAKFENGLHLFKFNAAREDGSGWHVETATTWGHSRTIIELTGNLAPEWLAILPEFERGDG